MDYALELSGVTKQYPLFTLDNITLRVPRGTIMGLIGENGAGKTTTLKLLMGIIRPDSGNIALLGEADREAMQRIKSRVGVVLDEGFFSDVFTARDIVRVCRNVYPNWDQPVFDSWMHKFKLPAEKKVKEYSKGMKMKLAITVALSHHPEVLVLDEATGGLDPVVRSEVLDVFLDFMQDENHAILFSTHITTDLERVADEITFLHEGKIVLQQNKDEIMENYGVLKCGQEAFVALDPDDYAGYRRGAYGYEVLLRERVGYKRTHPDAVIDPATLDDIMLYTIKGEKK